MSKLAQSIVRKIRTEGRKPQRFFPIVKRIFIWGVALLAIGFAAIFFGTTLAELLAIRPDEAIRWPGGTAHFFIETIAWLWLGAALFSITAAVAAFRLTRRGYRISIAMTLAFCAISAAIAGAVLLPSPLPNKMREMHDHAFPRTLSVERFFAPSEGRLIGEIVSIDATDRFTLRTPDEAIWTVFLFDSGTQISENDLVELFGEPLTDTEFAAISIRSVPPHHFVQGFFEHSRMTR